MSATQPSPSHSKFWVQFPDLPLAVYREMASHFQQIPGVETGLSPQVSVQFNYTQSQVGGLWIRYTSEPNEQVQSAIQQLLAYYGDRFGPYHRFT